jgi:hypothetical protein
MARSERGIEREKEVEGKKKRDKGNRDCEVNTLLWRNNTRTRDQRTLKNKQDTEGTENARLRM